MPSFRSASALIIFLGIFFPTFLNMIIRVGSIEKELLDSAKAMALTNWQMVTQILLPYVFPSVISGLKVTLTTSIMLLIFAEMMGATSGMGYYIINYTHYANYTNAVSYTHLDVYKRQGVTYMVLAPEHPMVQKLVAGTEYEKPVQEFISRVSKLSTIDRTSSDLEKEGMFIGAYAINPMTNEEVPIWITNYVLYEYGTGAVMGCLLYTSRCV